MSRPISPLLPRTDWSVAQPFWEGTARGEFRFPRCTDCGRYQWYPRVLCRVCMSPDFSWEPVAPHGSIYSFTVVRRPMLAGAEESVPFAVVLLHLDEAPGVTFITNLWDDSQIGQLAIGAATSIVFHEVTPEVCMPYAVID